jgi:hypothetical protein
MSAPHAYACGALIPQNAAFFTPKGTGAGRQISVSLDLEARFSESVYNQITGAI